MRRRGVTIGQWIGRRIPDPIGRHVLLPLCRRFAPGVYAEAMERAHNEGWPSPKEEA